MTLPTTTTLNSSDDDSDMFGPPRSSPMRSNRPKVPMISAKLRLREERKRILQLSAHKLERIKDSETNLRRSVCINNTYSRLTDEVRREKQNKLLANLPKSDSLNHQNSCSQFNNNNNNNNNNTINNNNNNTINNNNNNNNNNINLNNNNNKCSPNINNNYLNNNNNNLSQKSLSQQHNHQQQQQQHHNNNNNNQQHQTQQHHNHHNHHHSHNNHNHHHHHHNHNHNHHHQQHHQQQPPLSPRPIRRCYSSTNVETDLETLDREINALDAAMPLVDPEITQGAEQLEKAIVSRKRTRIEEEDNDRLVREALSQFYLPSPRLLSGIDDCPSLLMMPEKRMKNDLDLDLNLDLNQNQKEFDCIMDALRLGSDSCGQAAMMGETGVFHNLVVASLET